MSFIKTLASYYRQNLHLLGHHRFPPPQEIGAAPRGLMSPTVHAATKPNMEIPNASFDSKPSSSPPPPPRFPFFTWTKWALGAMLTIVLPFWDKKWRTLIRLEGEVEMVAEAMEDAAEVVEKVAAVTEKMAADAAERLPEDGKLKAAALFVENLSKEVAEEAHLTKDIIHKVDELKQEVEMLIDPIKERERLEKRDESHKD